MGEPANKKERRASDQMGRLRVRISVAGDGLGSDRIKDIGAVWLV